MIVGVKVAPHFVYGPFGLLLVLLVVLVVAACGSGAREIRGEAPLFGLESLIVDDSEITTAIGLRNVNDQSLHIARMKVRVLVADQLLLETETQPQLEISARGRDVIRVRATGESDGMAELERMIGFVHAGDRSQLPVNAAWQLELTLFDERGRSQDGQATGFLHPVPGRPGHFR